MSMRANIYLLSKNLHFVEWFLHDNLRLSLWIAGPHVSFFISIWRQTVEILCYVSGTRPICNRYIMISVKIVIRMYPIDICKVLCFEEATDDISFSNRICLIEIWDTFVQLTVTIFIWPLYQLIPRYFYIWASPMVNVLNSDWFLIAYLLEWETVLQVEIKDSSATRRCWTHETELSHHCVHIQIFYWLVSEWKWPSQRSK